VYASVSTDGAGLGVKWLNVDVGSGRGKLLYFMTSTAKWLMVEVNMESANTLLAGTHFHRETLIFLVRQGFLLDMFGAQEGQV